MERQRAAGADATAGRSEDAHDRQTGLIVFDGAAVTSLTPRLFALLLAAAPMLASGHADHSKPQFGGHVAEAGLFQAELVDGAGDLVTESGTTLNDELRTNQVLSSVVANIEHYLFSGSVGINFTANGLANRITTTNATGGPTCAAVATTAARPRRP